MLHEPALDHLCVQELMRLTTKGRFAVTAMVDLALQQSAGPVTLSAICERQHISLSYLEQLFAKLRKQGLVESFRGPSGGYVLAQPLVAVSVADIVRAVDEPLDATHCGGARNCATGQAGAPTQCMTHDLWETLNYTMVKFLESVSLQSLVTQQQARQRQQSENVQAVMLQMR